jgi:hypothetical protein
MNLPVVVQQQGRHGENCPEDCFFKVHLRSLNDDEVLVLLQDHIRHVTMGYNAKCATPLSQSF